MGKRELFALSFSLFTAMASLAIICPFLPSFAEKFGVGGIWIGILYASFAVSRAICMPIAGNISDKIGRKIFVTSGLLLLTVTALLYLLADNVYVLTAIRVGQGIAAAMVIPIVMAYVGESAEEGKEGRAMGRVNMVFFLGVGAGPLLGGVLNSKLGFDAAFLGMAFLGAATFLVALLLLPKEKKATRTETTTTGEVVGFRELMRHTAVRIILLTVFVLAIGMAVIMSFLPSLASGMHIGQAQLAILIFSCSFFAAILQPSLGQLSDRLSKGRRLYQALVGLFVCTVGLLVIPLCPNFLALLLVCALIGIGIGISMPVCESVSVLVGRKVGMGHFMGLFNSALSLGIIIGPLVSGVVMDHLGINPVFYLAGIVSLLGTLICCYYVWRWVHGYKIA